MTREQLQVNIDPPDIQVVELTLIGDAPLVTHKWSPRAVQAIEEKQAKKARKQKEARDPKQDFEDSLYKHPDGWNGLPAIAFKMAAVAACRFTEGLTMVMAKGLFYVDQDGFDEDGTALVRIESRKKPVMRRDMVRVGMGTSDLRYRPMFTDWRVKIRVRFNADILSAEQVVNLFQLAGLHVGVGEGRPGSPKSTMDWGRFHVATSKEAS